MNASATPNTTKLYIRAMALENDLRDVLGGDGQYNAEHLAIALECCSASTWALKDPALVAQVDNLYALVGSWLYAAKHSGMAKGERNAYLHAAELTAASARRIVALNRD